MNVSPAPRFAAAILKTGRQILRAVAFVTRPYSIGVHAAVIRSDGAVLVVRHTYKSGWYLPGGAVKKGEDVVEAMSRELQEETGLTPEITAGNIFGMYYCRHDFRHNHVVLFHIPIEEGVAMAADRFEIAEAKFCQPSEFPEETASSVNRRLAEISQKEQKTPRW